MNLISLPNFSLRPFLISMCAVFVMVFLHNLGIKPPQILNTPEPAVKADLLTPKLSAYKNNFSVPDNSSLITTTRAAEEFDQAAGYGVFEINQNQIKPILSKNLNTRLPIASLTKLMTAVVALDLLRPDDQLTVSQKASDMIPTKMGLIATQSWSLEELLNGMLLTSANDAAEVIKEGIDQKYGQGSFVTAVNQKAAFLRLADSHFANPQGLDDQQNYSSVADLAVLTEFALKYYPLIADTVEKGYQFYPATQNHKQADLYNWNGLLGVYPGVKGVKIGNTEKASYTTIVLSQRENHQVLAIVLGASGVLQRDLWAAQLLDRGFEKLQLSPINITEAQLKEKYASWKYFN